MNQLRSAQQRVPRLREGYGDRIGGKLGAGSQAVSSTRYSYNSVLHRLGLSAFTYHRETKAGKAAASSFSAAGFAGESVPSCLWVRD